MLTTDQNKARVALLIRGKADSRSKKIIRDKKKHYIIIKVSALQTDTTIPNMYVPNTRASKIYKTKLMESKEKYTGLLL